jgi:hypothetical protein
VAFENIKIYTKYREWKNDAEDAGYTIFRCNCIQKCREDAMCKSMTAINSNLEVVGIFKTPFSTGWLTRPE